MTVLLILSNIAIYNIYSAGAEGGHPALYDPNYGYMLNSDSVASIWWAEGTYKIAKRRALPTTKAEAISISAAKNEYEPFQLVIQPNRDLADVSVEVSDLRKSDGSKIPSNNIEVSVVEYLHVSVPTDKTGSVDDWPDPLPPYEGAFSLKAAQNQPLWLTVYVPKDASAGDYQGKVTLRSGNWKVEAQLKLHVWNFALPEETHVRSAFGLSSGLVRKYHNLETDAELRQVMDEYYQNFAKHRICPYDPMQLAPIKVSFSKDGAVLDFTEFDKAARRYLDKFKFNAFMLHLQGMGGGTFHSRHYGKLAGYEQGTPEYEKIFADYARQLQDHLEKNGWLNKAYVYWFDEPEPKDFDFVKEGMELIKGAAPKLTRLLTEEPHEALAGSVDLWCPITNMYNPEAAHRRQEAGEEVWWYICTGPKAPYCTLFIDHPAIELRMWLWQTYKYMVDGILIWQSNYWTSPTAFVEPKLQNPWQDPMSYVSGYGREPGHIGYWGNGDGRFIYPPNRDPENDKTKYFLGPVNSIRWEMLREGIEDYEYFWLLKDAINRLKAKGVSKEVYEKFEKLLEVSEEITSDLTRYTSDPQLLYAHRRKLAEAIEKCII